MNISYIDRLNRFFRYVHYNTLTPAAQLVYLHLLNADNQMDWAEEFNYPLNRLAVDTGLTKPTILAARNLLRDRGLIDFATDPRQPHIGTIYSFGKTFGKTFGKKSDPNSLPNLLPNSLPKSKVLF